MARRVKRKLVWEGMLSGIPARVYLVRCSSLGGSAITPSVPGNPYITIELSGESAWPHLVEFLLHEVFEMAMVLNDAQFQPGYRTAADPTTSCRYFLDHEKFQEVAGCAGGFVAGLFDHRQLLYKHWKEFNK